MTTPTKQHDSGANRQTSERERLAQACDRHDWVPIVKMCSAQLRADEAEIAQLRAEMEKVDALLSLFNAENEALRTVTDRNVHDALNAYDDATGEGWQLPCAQGMRAALQSFIRSKESRRG